jgi:hypothetical protein
MLETKGFSMVGFDENGGPGQQRNSAGPSLGTHAEACATPERKYKNKATARSGEWAA